MIVSKASAAVPRSPLAQDAGEIRGLCAVVTKIARGDHQRLLDRRHAGLGVLEHGVMRRLSHGAETLADLGRLMGVTPSTLVYVVDGLVRKGLVVRRADRRDRRRTPLHLTSAGRRALAAIPEMEAESVLVHALARMRARDRAAFLRHLRTFVKQIEGSDAWHPETRGLFRSSAARGQSRAVR